MIAVRPVRLRVFLAAVTAIAGAPVTAQADPPYLGKWAVEGPDACRYGVGTDDLKASFTAKRFEYYASACNVLSSRRLSQSGETAHRFKLQCEGEGTKTAREVILVVIEKSEQRPELLLHIDAASWDTLTYQRCGG